MFLDEGCTCRICRLSPRISTRVIDNTFRALLLDNYGADIARVWSTRDA